MWKYLFLCILTALLTESGMAQSSVNHRLGSALYQQGYYDSARQYLQKNFQQGDSLKEASLALYIQAASLAGHLPEATTLTDRLRQLALQKEDSLWYAVSFLLQSENLIRAGQLPSATEAYRQGLAVRIVAQPDTVTASLWRGLGLALFSQGQFSAADSLLQQAFAVMHIQLPTAHADWGAYFKLKGAVQDRQSNYDSAIYYYEKSLENDRQVYGTDHPETAKVMANLANVYHVKGKNLKALRYFEQARNTIEKFLGSKHPVVAMITNNMAIVDHDMGNFEKAISYYTSALNLFEQTYGSENIQASQIQNNLSSAYMEMNEADKALTYAQRALQTREKLLDRHNMLLVPVLVNMAGAYLLKHDYAKANAYANRAIAVYHYHDETLHPGLAESYTNLGESYLAQQQLPRALGFLHQASTISKKLYGTTSPKVAYIDQLLGNAYQQSGKTDSALYYYDEAIRVAAPGIDPDPAHWHGIPETPMNAFVARHILVDALSGKAKTLFAQYRQHPEQDTAALYGAFKIYQLLSGLIDMMRNDYQREESKLFLSGLAKPICTNAIEVAWALYEHTGEIAFAKQAFTFSEKNKYVLISDFLNDVSAKHTAGIPGAVLAEEEDLKSQLAYLEKQLYETTEDSLRRSYEIQLADLKKDYLDFTDKLEDEYHEYYALKYKVNNITVEQVQQTLSGDQQLVEYATTDSMVYVFSIHRDSLNFYRKRLAESLSQMVLNMRKGITEHDYTLYTQNAGKLYQLLAADWKKSHKQIIIIPDGMLGYVPFEILLTRPAATGSRKYWQLPYLIKDHVVSYHYSATLYLSEQHQEHEAQYQHFIAGFAPDFTGSGEGPSPADSLLAERGNGLERLVGAEQELRKIADMFKGKFFFGQQATKEHFREASQHSRVVHLGTHGIMNDQNPDMSYLVFAASPDSLPDNLLHTYEIYNMKINAELVTLSACNTGTGQLSAGEGVMSLARSFAYAGSPNVVTSLWAASDYATAQLMQRFYYYLSNGWDKNKALHQAKLDFLDKADDNLSDPYFWGSFVLVGNPQPLHIPRYTWVIWIIAILGIGAMGWFFYKKMPWGRR